jgi:hypothetical protein
MVIPRVRSSLLMLAVALAACKDSTDPVADIGRVRVVNSVFQGADTASAVPVAVDVLVDSSMGGAGLSALAALALSPGTASGQGAGTHAGAGALFTAAGYRDLPSGIHSFVARVSGTTASFFRTDAGEFLPRQYMLPFPYTFILAGVVPANTTPPNVPWAMIADDPFTPPADPMGGGLTARVQVINAAPMADPSGAGADITAVFDDRAGVADTVTASYRSSSGYFNPPAGTYTLTLTTGSGTLYTGTVTLAKGEVRSFIVQSTAYAATPGPGNTKVTNLLDNQW